MHLNYDVFGNVLSAIDAGGHATLLAYSSDFAHAYVTQVENALSHQSRYNYWPATGQLFWSKDQNDLNRATGSTAYGYDLMGRVVSVSQPDGAAHSYAYDDVNNKVTSSQTGGTTTYAYMDGLGRTVKSELADPEGNVSVEQAYDAVGRVNSIANPHRGSAAATDGTTTATYDAIGRVRIITKPDSNSVGYNYSGNCATVTDETGRKRKFCSDALGRTTGVWEDPDALNFKTEYQYDALGNLLRVDQKGDSPSDSSKWRSRIFTYDSLSHLLNASNPESGLITYTYDNDGNVSQKTDARGIASYFAYDSLHRLTATTYSDPYMAPASWTYDETSIWGVNPSNPVGRLTHTSRSGSSTVFSYDPMGRVNSEWPCTPSICGTGSYPFSVTYDAAGHVIALTYPSGRTVSNRYTAAGRLDRVRFESFGGQSVGYDYLNIPTGSDQNSWGYWPTGTTRQTNLGNSVANMAWYNNRQQPTYLTVSGSQVFSSKAYSYADPNRNDHNNGNVMSIVDLLDGGRNQIFGYDALNRLGSAFETTHWNQTYGIDAWGNMRQYGTWQNAETHNVYNRYAASTTGTCTYSAVTYCYDTAGNLTWDLVHRYAFDSESRLANVDNNTETYWYDAEGNRVRKDVVGSDSTEYIYFGGQVIAERNVTNGAWTDYIYANGKRVAQAYDFEDRLHVWGSTCANCGFQYAAYRFPNAAGLNGYTIRDGDVLYVRQTQFGNMRTGIGFNFTDGSYSSGLALYDTDGEQIVRDGIGLNGGWHNRTIRLTPLLTGKTINLAYIYIEPLSGGGDWQGYYNDIVLASADGTVHPIYTRQKTVGFEAVDHTSGMASLQSDVNHDGGAATYNFSVFYYHGDHLGTSRLMTNNSGWPIWQGTFLPYGQEWNPQSTTNNYKFTGLERDAETGLDHTWFRQHSPVMGRWMTPDPAGLAAVDLSNPQSLNRYSYVYNRPTIFSDYTGLNPADPDGGGPPSQNSGIVCRINGWLDVPCTALTNGGGQIIGYITVPYPGNWTQVDWSRNAGCVYDPSDPGDPPQYYCANGLETQWLSRHNIKVLPGETWNSAAKQDKMRVYMNCASNAYIQMSKRNVGSTMEIIAGGVTFLAGAIGTVAVGAPSTVRTALDFIHLGPAMVPYLLGGKSLLVNGSQQLLQSYNEYDLQLSSCMQTAGYPGMSPDEY